MHTLQLLLVAALALLSGCESRSRCQLAVDHLSALAAADPLQAMPAEARAALQDQQRLAFAHALQVDCERDDGAYTSCVLAASTAGEASACSGGAR